MKSVKGKLSKIMLSAVMVATIATTAMPVYAASVSTSEFGTMSYSLSGSGNTVTARTDVTKSASKLLTKLEIQVNSTGETLSNSQITAYNATSCPNIKATNYSVSKLAAFATHEARGNSSVAKYTSATF